MSEQLNLLNDQPISPEQRLWFRAALKECQAYQEHMSVVVDNSCFNCQQ